jgi:hypothetical protein
MFNLIIVIISILLIAFSSFLYKVVSGESLFKLNMISMSFWILGSLCFIPSLLIVLDAEAIKNMVGEDILYGSINNKFRAWALQYWLLIAIPIGCLFSKLLLNSIKIRPLRSFIKIYQKGKDINIGFNFNEYLSFYIILFFTLSYSVYILIHSMNENPLLVALTGGNPIDILIARGKFTIGFNNKFLDSLLNQNTVFLFCMLSFAIKKKYNHLKWKIIFIYLFILTLLISMISGTTGPIIFYLFNLGFLRYIISGVFVTKKELLVFISFFLFVFVFFKSKDSSSDLVINQIISRIFFDQEKGFYFALQVFPKIHPFLGFSSSAAWLNELISGKSSLDYGHILMYNYVPEAVEGGYAGHFTSIFLTEMWSNFGWIGVIFGPFWVGVVIYSLHFLFVNRKITIISIVIYAHLSVLGLGYFSDFVRFYYPANIILTYLGPILILFIGTSILHIFRFFIKGKNNSPFENEKLKEKLIQNA